MTQKIYISDRGLSLASGQKAADLLYATLSHLSLSQVDEDTLLESENYQGQHPFFSFLPHAPGVEELVSEALDQLKKLSPDCDQLFVILPDASQPSYPALQLALHGQPLPDNCILLSPAQLGKKLHQACQALLESNLKRLTLFGLDSLPHPPVAQHYLQNQRLRTQDFADGQILGQGWAWFTLGGIPSESENAVEWKRAAFQQAPRMDTDDLPSGKTLAACIQQVLEEDEQPLTKPRVWLHASGHTPQSDLETFLAHRQLWSTQGTPFRRLHHLLPARTLGQLGAAAFPMAVNLACERLYFPLDPAQEILLMDSQEDGTRLAVYLHASFTSTKGSLS